MILGWAGRHTVTQGTFSGEVEGQDQEVVIIPVE